MLYLEIQATPSNTVWITIASMVISLAAVIISYFNTKSTLASSERNNLTNLRAKNSEDRKDEIYKILNDLYGPFNQLRQKSNLLYQKFIMGKSPNNSNERFSTLLYLLDNDGPGKLSDNDKSLLNEIIQIGNDCEKLIFSKAGLIDAEELRTSWFPKAATHYLIIRLAFQGSLKGNSLVFKDSTFPAEIDNVIEMRIKALHAELGVLNGKNLPVAV